MASAIGRHNWQFKPLPGQPCHTLRMLFAALLSFSRYIRNDRTIPRNTRTPLANQLAFYAGKFLELIRRVAPDKVGELFMSDARKPNPNMPRPKGGKRGPCVLPTAPLSARQAAKRLEHFLDRITALADEAAKLGHHLPQQVRDLMARAHGSFGIDALYRTPQNLAGLRRALRGLPRPRPGQSFMPKAPSITPPTGQPLMPRHPPPPSPPPTSRSSAQPQPPTRPKPRSAPAGRGPDPCPNDIAAATVNPPHPPAPRTAPYAPPHRP